MATQYIRIPKSPEITEVIDFLKIYYKGMSECEIIKKNLIEDYRSKNPFDIFPSEKISSSLETELEQASREIENGEYAGPFDSAESFISSLQENDRKE